MRSILPTSSSSGSNPASVHPTKPVEVPPSLGSYPSPHTPREDGGGGGTELPDRSRWFHRVGDFFLGAPSSGLPLTTPSGPATDLAGGDQVTTTEETQEEPIIRWCCAFDFKRGEDNDALVEDGWRWRLQVYFTLAVVFATCWTLVAFTGVFPRWINAPARWFWVALVAAATVLALFQNSSCLRRSTAATMLHAIVHLVLFVVCVIALLVVTDWNSVPGTLPFLNVSCEGGGMLSSSGNTIVVTSFDAWVRREIALSLCLTTYFFALLLPVSRAGRWLGIVFQVTAVPAIQVRGERGGNGKSIGVTRYDMCVFPQLLLHISPCSPLYSSSKTYACPLLLPCLPAPL